MEAEKRFKELIEKVKDDPHVLGLFLGGSRGKGFETAYSDTISGLFCATTRLKRLQERTSTTRPDLEVFPSTTLSAFRGGAALDGETSWARYNFANIRAILDKTGEIQPLIEAKGRLPDDRREAYLRGVLDAYLNAHYRALKCHRIGNLLGTQLEALCGVSFFLAAIFGLEGRRAPYLGDLERELRAYPL